MQKKGAQNMKIHNITDLLTAGFGADMVTIKDTHGNGIYQGSIAGIPSSVQDKTVVHMESVPDTFILVYIPYVDNELRI